MLRRRKYIVWITALLCAVSLASCAVNKAGGASVGDLYGTYEFKENIYTNPLSSYIPVKGYMPTYTLTKDSLVITEIGGEKRTVPAKYEQAPVDKDAFEALFMSFPDFKPPDISVYKDRYRYTLNDGDTGNPLFRLYLLDDTVWLAQLKDDGKQMWCLYELGRTEGSNQ